MKILIGTNNPGKKQGAQEAFEKYFDNVNIESVNVSSEVSDEPVNDEIYNGVNNRVKGLKEYAEKNNINPDFFIAIESGVTNSLGMWLNVNLAMIESKDGKVSYGTAQSFPIPDKYIDEIIEKDLGSVMDRIFDGNKLSKGKGGISFLTHDEVSRIDLTRNAFIMALTKYINDDIWE